jgi:hypothetical protein
VSGVIAQLFLNLGNKRGCVVSTTPRPPLFRERHGTHCTGGWVGPGASLDRCGKSRPTGIRSPDLPARNELLYRIRYPGSSLSVGLFILPIFSECVRIFILPTFPKFVMIFILPTLSESVRLLYY